MLLLIIVIQLCKKTQSTKRISSDEQKRNVYKSCDESPSQFEHGRNEEYIEISSSQQ